MTIDDAAAAIGRPPSMIRDFISRGFPGWKGSEKDPDIDLVALRQWVRETLPGISRRSPAPKTASPRKAEDIVPLIVEGKLKPEQARAIVDARREARLDEERLKSREEHGPELFTDQGGADLLAAYEGIVDGRARKAAVAFTRELAKRDDAWLGDLTDPEAIIAKLKREGLDDFGEEA